MVSVFQIYFDEQTYSHMDPAFYPYKKMIDDNYFENSVIKQVYDMNPALKEGIKYIGVTSWKQKQKTHYSGNEIIDRIEKDIDSGTEKDVYIYSAVQGLHTECDYSTVPPKIHGTIRFIDIWEMHKQYPQVIKDNCLLNDSKVLPFDLFDKWQYCHQNYWIAKKAVFDEYCKTVLIPAINFYELPETIKKMPKWYQHPHSLKYYNSCCFTMEGLFGAFLAHSNYSFEYLCRQKIRTNPNKYQEVQIDGYNKI